LLFNPALQLCVFVAKGLVRAGWPIYL
jgi:hypothetical protein